VIYPLWLLLRYFLFGGKEQQRLRDLERERNYPSNNRNPEAQKLNSIAYA